MYIVAHEFIKLSQHDDYSRILEERATELGCGDVSIGMLPGGLGYWILEIDCERVRIPLGHTFDECNAQLFELSPAKVIEYPTMDDPLDAEMAFNEAVNEYYDLDDPLPEDAALKVSNSLARKLKKLGLASATIPFRSLVH